LRWPQSREVHENCQEGLYGVSAQVLGYSLDPRNKSLGPSGGGKTND
jgi:hypothetical protein